MEMVVGLFAILGALGLPLSMPPLPPDPVVLRAAPEDCLYYLGWAGNAEPNGSSPNRSEQILASPEVKQFVIEFSAQITGAAQQAAQGNPDAQIAADNLPGIVHALFTHPTAIYLAKVAPTETGMQVSGGLVVNLGADAPAVSDKINKVRASILANNPEIQPKPVTIGGVNFQQFSPDPAGPEVFFGFKDSLLIVAVGADEAQALAARLQGSGPPAKWYQELQQKMAVDRPAVTTFINVAAIFQAAGPALSDPKISRVLEGLGLAQVTSIGGVNGLTSSGATSKTLIATQGEPQGIFTLLPTKPLTLDDLKTVPRDATFSTIMRLDLADFVLGVVDIASKIDPSAGAQFDQGMQMAQQQLGLNVMDDVLKPLGDSWTFSAFPDAGSMPGTGLVATVSLDDRAKFSQSHDQLLAMFKGLLAAGADENKPTLTESMVGETKVYTLASRDLGPFTPSWCIAEKHLVVAANARLVEQFLKRDPAAPTLADVKAYQILFGRSAPAVVTYQDTLSLLRQVYPLAQIFGPAGVAQLNSKLGIQAQMPTLPNPEKIASHITPNVSLTSRRADGVIIERYFSMPLNVDLATMAPAAAALMLPAIQSAREASRGVVALNCSKNIVLAMQNNHAAKGSFPPRAIFSKDGKPLLSWRVAILPYLEEQALYERFHLDEPWDSEHNRQLIETMPQVYSHPGSPELTKQFKTRYLVPQGEATLFNGEKVASFQSITDGTSNTILTVVAAPERAVIWTRPDDLVVDPKNPIAGLSGDPSKKIIVGLADGAVRSLPESIDPEVLRRLFNPRDGQPVEIPNR